MNDRNRKKKKRSKKNKDNRQTRNKAKTIELFREAAKRILSRGGVKALGINSLQKEAGKSKSLIYSYFGGITGVLRDALDTNDVWLSYYNKIRDIISQPHEDHGRSLAETLLKEHLDRFFQDSLAQEISLLELSSKGDTMLKELSESREYLGNKLFNISDKHFSNGNVSIRMVFALLIGGINYMVLHANSNGSTFCGVDIHTQEDLELMNKTLEQIVAWAYEHAA